MPPPLQPFQNYYKTVADIEVIYHIHIILHQFDIELHFECFFN